MALGHRIVHSESPEVARLLGHDRGLGDQAILSGRVDQPGHVVCRLGATHELRATGTSVHITSARIITNDREQPEFHDVVLWRQHSDFAWKYMVKGRLAYIEGRLQSRTWEAADGCKRRTVEAVADKLRALLPKQAAEAAA
jgi:single-strand DNA-binding protein